MNVVYEVYEIQKQVYGNLHVYHKPTGRWVVSVVNNWRITLTPPKQLTPWKLMAVAFLALAVTWFIIEALNNLEKPM
ncbi:hypothetical protein [Vulcanisaeta thermophila]|uniref:hypothetical protein n=1 Tax=Vulcanisaeta thermophila TaxID=867917 RepID=UPI0008528DF1|nr:hypothetical protein [Vulcanisaeta thermophila]